MSEYVEPGTVRSGSRWRTVGWSAAGLLLLLPLVAMQFTEEVDWGVGDFVIFGSLLVAAGVTFELVVRKTGDWVYRFAVGVAIAVSAGLGSAGPIWPWGIVLMTAFFTALWLVSAGLFQKAAGQDANRIDAGA